MCCGWIVAFTDTAGSFLLCFIAKDWSSVVSIGVNPPKEGGCHAH